MLDKFSLQLNLEESLRYMGFHGEPDSDMIARINSLCDELRRYIAPKHVVKRFACTATLDTVTVNDTVLNSKSIAQHLNGCDELFLFAATLGVGADNLIRRYSITDIANSSMLQAISASLIEAYCDAVQSELTELLTAEEGLYLRKRFSPGYGDLALSSQAYIIRQLQAEKAIGLCISDSLMLIPSKSVTAIIGIGKQPCVYSKNKCDDCSQAECPYRNKSK